MKYYILLSIIPAILILCQGCSDCPLDTPEDVFICETRIVTLEKFNPNFTISKDPITGEIKTTLDPDYNIGVFQFPINSQSSGSFPNDYRFKNTGTIAVASEPFTENGKVYYAAYMNGFPPNSELKGDILVSSVSLLPADTSAMLMFSGSLERLARNFRTENSQEFCDFVKANMTAIEKSFSSYTALNRYGSNQTGASIINFKVGNPIVTDEKFNVLGTVGQAGIPAPGTDVLDRLSAKAEALTGIAVNVMPGDVFTYIAQNGKRFVFVVTEIRQTNLLPFRQRVSIMFYPLDK